MELLSEDLNKKMKQITELLGQENMSDNIQALLSALTNTGNKEEHSPKSNEKATSKEDYKADNGEKTGIDDHSELLRQAKKVVNRFSQNNDPRINLLNAIRPFLNSHRQEKVSNCIKILHLSRIVNVMDEHEP